VPPILPEMAFIRPPPRDSPRAAVLSFTKAYCGLASDTAPCHFARCLLDAIDGQD